MIIKLNGQLHKKNSYYHLKNKYDTNLPKPNLDEVKREIYALTDSIDNGLILSCHDISDGGLGIAVSEMSFENNIGCKINIDQNLKFYEILFSETGGFVMEIDNNNLENTLNVFSKYDIELYTIGKTGGDSIVINNFLDVKIEKAKDAWENGLNSKL